jgi:transcription-repair coupling factor (superfamily II helicase)
LPNQLINDSDKLLLQNSTKKSDLSKTYTFQTHPQPPFNKDFNLLAKNLGENQEKNYVNFILSESLNQFEKIQSILEEIDGFVKIQHLTFSLSRGFIDDSLKIALYTDHQIFDRFYRYKSKEKHSKSKAITLKELRILQPGDYVTHADYGIAKFVGLEKIEVNGVQQEAIRLLFKDNDLMKVSILALHKISKYSGKEGEAPTMSKLGSQEWENKKKAVKKKVKEIAIDLIGLYAKRKAAPGFAFNKDTYLQAELETSFIYEDTPDQAKATEDVKKDMEKPHPMDRLVCGDVGFGKTEIAIRAAFKAVNDSKQVAVLVPTTILAMQHFKTFRDRLEKFPCRVEYVSRFRTAKQVAETLKRLEEGKTDILIGTHKLLSDKVKFKNLGLLIIDEEQKFGVAAKEKFKEFKINIDTLTLTATPIPRTLNFSLMGARDLSIIATPPPNRQPITTEVHTYNEAILRDAISTEIKRGGQAFVIHNRVSDLYTIGDTVRRLVPDSRVIVAHGQMEGEELEKAMLKFIDGEADVLISTNIIESGLDIPNANTMLINNAHHFGLSDLHQMRGRVGRSNKKAFCYLLAPPLSVLTGDAKKKLSALEEFSDLGDGFKVAMRDLDIRGAGNLLGGEQSGFITDIGYDLYHKLLNEAISELKENEFKALFEHELSIRKDILPECSIETDLAILIPEQYVSNISERLGLYNELDNLKDITELDLFTNKLVDRFGKLPQEVIDLLETVQLRWVAEQIGFDKLTIKNTQLKAQFASMSDKNYFNGDIFGRILEYVKKNPKICTLRENKEKLTLSVDGIKSVQMAIEICNHWLLIRP